VTSAGSASVRVDSPDARTRIIGAGIRCLIRDGIADATMAAIAEEGDVSKALLHYHFADRAHLVAEIVSAIGRRLAARERAAMLVQSDDGPVDILWQWLSAELARGELRALLATHTIPDEPVRTALDTVLVNRRETMSRTVTMMFDRLGLTMRIPAPVVADTCITFIDGLAFGTRNGADARLRFDVFSLALLSLGE
jgi:AcrR family transcriptional regulator